MATLKRIEKIVRENAFDEKKKRLGLKFNPGLALIGLRTTGPWAFLTHVFKNSARPSYTHKEKEEHTGDFFSNVSLQCVYSSNFFTVLFANMGTLKFKSHLHSYVFRCRQS